MNVKIIKSFKNVIEYIYDRVSYWSVNENSNDLERDFTILLNQYLGLLFVIFFVHGMSVYYFIGFTKNTFYLILISMIFLSSFILKEYRKNIYILIITFLFLNLIITYYSSYCGIQSGVFLFYFPLLLAIPFFFDIKKSKWATIFIMTIILASLYISAIEDFNLVPTSSLIIKNNYLKKLLILNITFSLLSFMITNYFVGEKKCEYYHYIIANKTKTYQINELQTKIEQLKSQLSNTSLSDSNINEILDLAQSNSSLFVEKFDIYFPDFFDKIKNSSNGPISFSDLYLCAMIKLNFSNKQIALYSNSTVKSVESKKYRLRKKLNIPANQEFTLWILSI